MNNQKQQLYQNVIREALERILRQEQNISVVEMINKRLNTLTIKLKYDKDFFFTLVAYLNELSEKNTLGQEYVLEEFLEICENEFLILKDQVDLLFKQIIILKRLRRIYDNYKKDPKKIKKYLQQEYNQEEDKSADYLIDMFGKDKEDLKMKIEPEIRSFAPQKNYLNDNNQFSQQRQSSSPNQNLSFEEILQNIYETQKLSGLVFNRLMKEVLFIREIVQEMNLKKLLGLDYVTVQPYGSVVSGFAQQSSDVDVSINTNSYLPEQDFLKLLKNFIDWYCKNKQIKVETEIINAKTPLLKYNRIDEEGNKIDLDICVNNVLGCANSRMLSTLSQIHPIIPKLGIVIKQWAKANQISGKAHLSSYSFILMMFYFMFREKVLNSSFVYDKQNNKDTSYEVKIKRSRVLNEPIQDFTTNLYYNNNVEILKQQLQKSINKGGKKNLDDYTLSELFTKFIDFYSKWDKEEKKFVSIFNFDKNITNYDYPLFNKEFFINIEDPFDLKHNPGEKTKKNSTLYQEAFQNTLANINNNQFQKLFPSN